MEIKSTEQSRKSDMRYVEVIGFGRRFFAIIIDGVFIFLLSSLMIAFILGMAMIVLDWWTSASDWPWRDCCQLFDADRIASILHRKMGSIIWPNFWEIYDGDPNCKFRWFSLNNRERWFYVILVIMLVLCLPHLDLFGLLSIKNAVDGMT